MVLILRMERTLMICSADTLDGEDPDVMWCSYFGWRGR